MAIWTVGLEASAETPIFGLELLSDPVALVIGAEGAGLSKLVRQRLDHVVHVPMVAGSESLNASVAAALAMYEIQRIRGWE